MSANLKIVEYDMKEVKGIKGPRGVPLQADFGIAPMRASQLNPKWLRPGTDTSPDSEHRILRVGARFWNAGDETFFVGSAWENPDNYGNKWPGDGPKWMVPLANVWKFELAIGPEKDLVLESLVEAVIAPIKDPKGNSHPIYEPWDWCCESGFYAESLGDPYYSGLTIDLTGVADTKPGEFYWFKIILDPTDQWKQKKELEMKVTLEATDFKLVPE